MSMCCQQHSSIIDPAIVTAYAETEFRVLGDPAFTLRCDRASPELVKAMHARTVNCATFITAANPYSRRYSDADNAKSLALLKVELASRSLPYVPGLGIHPSGECPGEESLLVYGLALEAARTLGAQYQQNAIVWAGANAVPSLILLR
jgi:Protein of unknown function (DUF3293)